MNTQNRKKLGYALTLALATTVAAALNYDQNIVAIFGSGNPDSGWTTATNGSLTLALRAKNRENASTVNASGVYSEPTGYQAPNNNRARWNFEFSISTGTPPLNTADYYLQIDLDPSTAVAYQTVNALTFFSDDSYGTSSTLNGQGLEGPAAGFVATSSVAQQSQNLVFYGGDPNEDATYDYALYAVAVGAGPNGTRLATTSITVVVGAGGSPPPDDDGDGVPNSEDQCPNTADGDTVNAHGCSIDDLVINCAYGARNHGQFVSCVTQLANQLYKDGLITKARRQEIITDAAKSGIGK